MGNDAVDEDFGENGLPCFQGGVNCFVLQRRAKVHIDSSGAQFGNCFPPQPSTRRISLVSLEPSIEFPRCLLNAEMGQPHGQTTYRAAHLSQCLSSAADAVGFPRPVALKINRRFDDGKMLERFAST